MASIDEIKELFDTSNSTINSGFERLLEEMKDYKEEIKQIIAESSKYTNEKVEMLEAKLGIPKKKEQFVNV